MKNNKCGCCINVRLSRGQAAVEVALRALCALRAIANRFTQRVVFLSAGTVACFDLLRRFVRSSAL
jgi:hypothetical protein